MQKAPQADFPSFEANILKTWASEKTFEKSLLQRVGSPRYSFYDGPPFANGQPHFGHTLVTSIKDSIGRYKTMNGFYVERKNGWDCHGLPVEFAIEKELGVSGKKQILEDVGLKNFNDACRSSVFKYKNEWEDFFSRAGRWTDSNNSYQTIDTNYTESVWWMLGQVNAKKLLYRGYKSMPYCPRCETPLSNFEVNEGYKENTPDPSVYVKFKLKNQTASMLAWTTTPWSLPGNAAIGINPTATYVCIETKNDSGEMEELILAKSRIGVITDKYRIIKEIPAQDLVGLEYSPLFNLIGLESTSTLYRIWESDAVSIEDGTGVLHIAPAFGEDDLNIANKNNIPVLTTVKPNGHISDNVPLVEIQDKFFKGADKSVIKYLSENGSLYLAETFNHIYPFCYRCDTPLLYYAISTWFIRVSAIREQLLATAESIDWQPAHIKNGRFGKWLEGARDWAISRNRYWGAPMPIWQNVDDHDDYIVISSIDELMELSDLHERPTDLHRPDIDKIEIVKDGKTFKRVEEVFDCWFESGSMPVAQHHYPFENKEVFEGSFPADYIGEGLDQTRLWFYVQHVLATIVFGKPAYKQVLVNGMIMAPDGQKLSKKLKNYPPVEDVFSEEGADTLRFYLLGNDQALGADYMRFDRTAMGDIQRNVFSTVWNTYGFLSLYAEIDKWIPAKILSEPTSQNVLDIWMIARLNQTITQVTEAADNYQIARALRPIRALIDDLSNWYVRRSRRRFWKSEDDGDKAAAYATLHYTLARISQLLAPWSPFVSDVLWRGLMADTDEPTSVHLTNWPKPGTINVQTVEEMKRTRSIVEAGLSIRSANKLKVRQPLSQLEYLGSRLDRQYEDIVAEEVNVKTISKLDNTSMEGVVTTSHESVRLNLDLTPELLAEGLMRDVVRQIQTARKQQGLNVEDRIVLSIQTVDPELLRAIRVHEELIKHETLAVVLNYSVSQEGLIPSKIAGREMLIEISLTV